MANKIRKDDQVIIMTGKYKGQQGTVLRVFQETKRILVQGVNIVKKHVRPNPNKGVQGGIIEREMPIDISNVAILNGAQKPDRVGFKILEDGRKVRYFKSSGEVIDR